MINSNLHTVKMKKEIVSSSIKNLQLEQKKLANHIILTMKLIQIVYAIRMIILTGSVILTTTSMTMDLQKELFLIKLWEIV